MTTNPPSSPAPILALTPARVQRGADGGWRNADYDDVYFQVGCGIDESHFVFLEKNRLRERIETLWRAAQHGHAGGTLTVAELGFGTGLNMLLVCALWREIAVAHPIDRAYMPSLFLVSIEKHPIEKHDLRDLYTAWPQLRIFSDAIIAQYPYLVRGFHTLNIADDITLQLCFGDVRDMLPQLHMQADAWFLDGFTPSKNPDMWDDSLYAHLYRTAAIGGTLSTFSSAGHVRRKLAEAGFSVKKVKGHGIKWSMTIAARDNAAPQPHSKPQRVGVIGAGIAGASIAHALAERGCSVTVFDRHNDAAAEASGNAVGIIYPKLTVDAAPMGQLYSHAYCYTTTLLKRLGVQSWQPCGVIKRDDNETARTRTLKLMGNHHYPRDFAAPHNDGLFFAGGGTINPPEFTARLLDHPNITCSLGVNATLDMLADFDHVVIATANAARALLPDAELPLRPLRGQIVSLKATPQSLQLNHVICHEGYITPAINGVHYAGATFQKEEPPSASDHRDSARDEDNLKIVDDLAAALPEFGFDRGCIMTGRAAYRATTPDKLPMLGRVAQYPNISILAGFGAHGLTTAPLCAAVLASMICDQPLPVPLALLDHVQVGRFAQRAARKNPTSPA